MEGSGHHQRHHCKVMSYHTLVQAIVLYNAESWTLKEEHKRKLSVFEMSVLRRICGITRRDRVDDAMSTSSKI